MDDAQCFCKTPNASLFVSFNRICCVVQLEVFVCGSVSFVPQRAIFPLLPMSLLFLKRERREQETGKNIEAGASSLEQA